MRYLVIYEQGEASWGAYIPDLPGCVAVGENREEARRLIREAMELHHEAMQKDGDPIPEPRTDSEFLELAG